MILPFAKVVLGPVGRRFLTVKAVAARGIRNLYLMAFLCMKSGEVIVSSSAARPNSSIAQGHFSLPLTGFSPASFSASTINLSASSARPC